MQTDKIINISVKKVLISLRQVRGAKTIYKQFSLDLLDNKKSIDVWATCKDKEIFLFASKDKLIRFIGAV